MWEELEWEGAHAHAPVVLVAKPHYWRQLRVAQSVANFAARCPHFWRSAEFGACLAGGHILATDLDFFARVRPLSVLNPPMVTNPDGRTLEQHIQLQVALHSA